MNINLPYLVDVAIAITVFYAAYFLLFSKEKMFVFNRIYLITSMLVSFIIPLITFTEHIVMPATTSIITTSTEAVSNISATSTAQASFGLSQHQLLGLLFILGVVFFLTTLIVGHIKVLIIIKKSSNQSLYGYDIKVTQKDIPPFTYFNKLIIPSKVINTPHIQSVIHHENIHKKEGHCIDILFMEAMFLFQWFNPFAWLMKKAIRDNIEFLADDKVTGFVDKHEYQLGIISLAGKTAFHTFPSLSNQSQLKKRIIMMTKNKKSKFQWVRALVIIPMLAIMTVTLSGREVQVTYQEVIPPKTEEAAKIEDTSQAKSKEVKGTVLDENGKPQKVECENLEQVSDTAPKEKTFFLRTRANTINTNPLVIIDGKICEEGQDVISKMKPEDIESFTILKDSTATNIYGEKAKDGVISIITKNKADKQNATAALKAKDNQTATYTTCDADNSLQFRTNANSTPVFIVDDKKYAPDEFDTKQLDPNDIESVSVIKGKDATEIYGDEAKDGVVIIKTKNKADKRDETTDNAETTEPGATLYADKILNRIIDKQFTDQPIIIIDGEEYADLNILNEIEAKNIASFTILKDAKAVSLYGEKAKDGVISITTKNDTNL